MDSVSVNYAAGKKDNGKGATKHRQRRSVQDPRTTTTTNTLPAPSQLQERVTEVEEAGRGSSSEEDAYSEPTYGSWVGKGVFESDVRC